MRQLCYFANQHTTLTLLLFMIILVSCGPQHADADENPQMKNKAGMVATPPVEKIQQDATHTDRNVPVTEDQVAKVNNLEVSNRNQQEKENKRSKTAAMKRAKEEQAKAEGPENNAAKPRKPMNKASVSAAKFQANELQFVSHGIWNKLLTDHVSSTGSVDYADLKANENKLDDYLEMLKDNHPGDDWKANRAKAYWLNAYNAFTVKLILDNYPVRKITDLYGGKPWDVKWIELGDKKYSLNNIEHQVIRPTYNDPRIHFAVNCAATSCPPLHNRAFTTSGLDATLSMLTKQFINNTAYNEITANGATVSKIFEWYAEDFGDLRNYLNKYSDTPLEEKAEIGFKEYDWDLND